MLEAEQAAWIQEYTNKNRMSTEEALALCDALPVVTIDMLVGRWRGTEIFTSHPLNGLLGIFGWYGKEFIDQEQVYPLLFSDSRGQIFLLDPQRLPVSLALRLPITRIKLVRQAFLLFRFAFQTRKAKARVRMIEYRGKVSAAMMYDNLPIYDTFRLIEDNTLLGVMDLKGSEQPFFFKLYREG